MPYTEKLVQMKNQSSLSTQQIADKSGVPASTITRMLSGQTEEPSFTNIAKVVKAMGGSLDDIAGIDPKVVTVTKTETVHEDERLISLYERAISNKNAWIRKLFIINVILITFLIVVLIYDLANPDAGWYQAAKALIDEGAGVFAKNGRSF